MVHIQNRSYWHMSSWDFACDSIYNYPISSAYITTNFGHEAKQIQSGESVVILAKNAVFKMPLNQSEASRLRDLTGTSVHSQIGFPLSVKHIREVKFFEYEKYFPPIAKYEIMQSRGRVWYTRIYFTVLTWHIWISE